MSGCLVIQCTYLGSTDYKMFSADHLPRRKIFKQKEIAPSNEHKRCQLIKSLLRGLDKAVKEQIKYGMFLQLVNCHISDETIPPGLKIDLKPPGPHQFSVLVDWNKELLNCSKKLLLVLHKHYTHEINRCSWLVKCFSKQCVILLVKHNQCTEKLAQEEITQFIDNSVDNIMEIMSKGESVHDSKNLERSACLHVSILLKMVFLYWFYFV